MPLLLSKSINVRDLSVNPSWQRHKISLSSVFFGPHHFDFFDERQWNGASLIKT